MPYKRNWLQRKLKNGVARCARQNQLNISVDETVERVGGDVHARKVKSDWLIDPN